MNHLYDGKEGERGVGGENDERRDREGRQRGRRWDFFFLAHSLQLSQGGKLLCVT